MKPSFLNDRETKKSQSETSKQTRASQLSKTTRKLKAEIKDQTNETGLFTYLIRYTGFTIIITLAIGTLLYIKRGEWNISNILNTEQITSKPNPEKYAIIREQLETQRLKLKNEYLSSTTNARKQQILNQGSALLENSLPKMMRCWLGHAYDFNGTATIPGEGKIACGYYVSTIMKHAGFKINRIKVAQQPSQNIIRTFVDHKRNYKVKVSTAYPEYVADITDKYEGINIVGLDTHVAFIVIKDGDMRYIHSSGGSARSVVDQGVNNAYSLKNSNYRVISNLSRNPDVIQKWILGIPFSTGGIHAPID